MMDGMKVEYRDPIDVYPKYCLDKDLPHYMQPITMQVDQAALDQWLTVHHAQANYTRLLRYYLSSTVLGLKQDDVLLDVGSGDAVYASLVGDRVSRVVLNDLALEQHGLPSHVTVAEQNVFELDIASYNINKIVVGHAFEHFRGDDDIRLIRFISRALPVGGICCIEPVFMGHAYLEVYSYPTDEHYDVRATPIVTKESKFPGRRDHHMGFARIYDAQAFHERVIQTAEAEGLECQLITFKLGEDYLPDMEKYAFKRKQVNYPLRAFRMTKRKEGIHR